MCKVNMEWKLQLNLWTKTINSHSWVRISHDLNTLVTDLIDRTLNQELNPIKRTQWPLIPHCRTMCQFRTSSSSTFVMSDVQSIHTPSLVQDRLREDKIQAGKNRRCSFTAVNPMHKEHRDPQELDLIKPRLASYKQKWKKGNQDSVDWVDFQFAQRKGLKFYQRRCNAITLYDTFSAYCFSKVVVMESEEIIFSRKFLCHLYHHRRFLAKIIQWLNWIQKSLEAAKIPNESNQEPNH